MPKSQNFKKPLFAGIDVGGTNIKIGFVDDLGEIVAKTKFPTQPAKSPEVAIEQTKLGLDKLLETTQFDWSDVAAAGLGTPGPMDISQGTILTPVNLPGWHNFPICDQLSKALEKPVTFSNDANACLLYTSPSPRDLSTSRMPSSA